MQEQSGNFLREEAEGTSETTHEPSRPVPWLTFFIMALCAFIFIQMAALPKPVQWVAVHKFGMYSSTDIWTGKYWSLMATAFLHMELWHVAFNLYWFFIFAREIERSEGKLRLFTLLATSAFFTGACELIFAAETGIGLSGVVYCLFGYIVLREKTSEHYTGYISTKVYNLFIFWLFLCYGLTYLELMNVGNAAHMSGLLWGFFLAAMCANTISARFQMQGVVLLIAFLFAIWQPWNTDWCRSKGVEAHLLHDYEGAKQYYQKVVEEIPRDQVSLENLRRIRIVQLSDSAQKAEYIGDVKTARKLYLELEGIDPGNELAHERLNRLPRR